MNMYLFVLCFIVISSIIYLKLAVKFKIIDKPNHRSSHTKITVRGGGIIFTLSILLFFLLNDFQYPYFTLAVLIISVISFLDDIYDISSKIRFPFQLLSIILIVMELDLFSNHYFLPILFISLGVGVVNMFNFMDGINGITGLYSLVVVFTFYFINVNEQIINHNLLIYFGISLLVFCYFNFRNKAIFFAGDIGSVTIGVLLFFVGSLFAISLNSPLILLMVIVYGADAGTTLLYRLFFTKESLIEPHRHHIYQKLVDKKKMSHLKVSSLYAFVQLIVNIIVFKSYRLDIMFQYFIFFGLILIFIFFYIYLYRITESNKN